MTVSSNLALVALLAALSSTAAAAPPPLDLGPLRLGLSKTAAWQALEQAGVRRVPDGKRLLDVVRGLPPAKQLLPFAAASYACRPPAKKHRTLRHHRGHLTTWHIACYSSLARVQLLFGKGQGFRYRLQAIEVSTEPGLSNKQVVALASQVRVRLGKALRHDGGSAQDRRLMRGVGRWIWRRAGGGSLVLVQGAFRSVRREAAASLSLRISSVEPDRVQ